MNNSQLAPTILVVLGATGDLMARKIVPALYHLHTHDRLPKMFHVVGFSRRELSDEKFKDQIAEIIKKDKAEIDSFIQLFSYHKGDFTNSQTYQELAKKLGLVDKKWQACANKLFYLAVPPNSYEVILTNLADSGLTTPCSNETGWTRVLVEKPFGNDLKTAQALDMLLAKLFKEEQIYRIDHYLAKEMLQGIINFRFSNNLFEGSWNNQLIERIDISLLETIGVENRGSFYDGNGALRDVGQNHLLQMIALIAMDHPETGTSKALREKRAEIIEKLKILSSEDIRNKTYRAQYAGYKTIDGVNPNSQTETYFDLQTELTDPRWIGVPIRIQAGKRLDKVKKEIIVTFKHPEVCLYPECSIFQNKVTFSLEPDESITVEFWIKKPGLDHEVEKRELNFFLYEKTEKTQYVEEYGKLLLDCIFGDQTLFVSTQEVKAMWAFIDPIIKGWENNLVPLNTYKPNTNEPLKKLKITKQKKIVFPVGIIGLGKMGAGIAEHLLEQHWPITVYSQKQDKLDRFKTLGAQTQNSIEDFVKSLPVPRVVWLMVPQGSPVDETIDKLLPHLDKEDIIIDGGNSFYKDSIKRAEKLKKLEINFIDAGVSGGPYGARHGAALMVGGDKKIFNYLKNLFKDLSIQDGVAFFKGHGAGHFVKMIHNGIEYGMMQAIAEGFAILEKADYNLDLTKVSEIYNNGSVIESKLVGWLKKAFDLHTQELKDVTSTVAHTGEGMWTVDTAKELKIKTKVIKDALQFRIESENNPSYMGKIVSALREQFGGHSVK